MQTTKVMGVQPGRGNGGGGCKTGCVVLNFDMNWNANSIQCNSEQSRYDHLQSTENREKSNVLFYVYFR